MHGMLTLQAEGDPGFLDSIVSNIPFDAAAIFVYALIAGSVCLIWWANRKGARSGNDGEGPEKEHRSRPEAEREPGRGAT